MIVVAITGASGVIYGIRLLEVLKELNIENSLVISDAAKTAAIHQVAKANTSGIYAPNKIKCKIFRNNSSGIAQNFRTGSMIPAAIRIYSAVMPAPQKNAPMVSPHFLRPGLFKAGAWSSYGNYTLFPKKLQGFPHATTRKRRPPCGRPWKASPVFT